MGAAHTRSRSALLKNPLSLSRMSGMLSVLRMEKYNFSIKTCIILFLVYRKVVDDQRTPFIVVLEDRNEGVGIGSRLERALEMAIAVQG